MGNPPRRRTGYPTDLSDAQWQLIEPLLPAPACTQPTGGRPESNDRRDVINAILYVVDNGIKWRAMPIEYPPWSSVYKHFARWAEDGTVLHLCHALSRMIRQSAGRCPRPVTGIIDSQSVKAAETVGRASRGYDAGKKINGRKRHVLVDMFGLPIAVLVTPADIRDGDAAQVLLVDCRTDNPQLAMIWGDSAYGGDLIEWAEDELRITVKTVRPPPDQVGFKVHPRRWRVERSLSWITQRRRNARDYERRADYSAAHILWAFVLVMSRRLTRPRRRRTP